MPDRPLTRICYVEDDEDIQRIVRMSLERVGKMTVAVVSDPTQALQAFAEFRPDLVMLDWMMPVLDGPALFRQMKLRPETSGHWRTSRYSGVTPNTWVDQLVLP